MYICVLVGFWSENDKESPPRESLENRAPQEASSQERPPDECSVYFHGARHQSSGRWEQGPEGTQDDTTREGEVSGPLPLGEALRSSLVTQDSVTYLHQLRVERALELDACCVDFEPNY
ncbi:hypothetical protein H671_3g9741 [Cricetulus griseus]|uniref:Uncharacterized protein n=1 Tax=Cricetulus griseus TaxID=10029 RepID=A0A061IF14_CRIGR|nr:hypothetical protein H671_3g9741 [Cricetulus griseus]